MLAKTLDIPLFQRALAFIGHPDMSNYTMQVDIMTDGNRRTKSSAGVINQRYLILLKGNHQELEISSNDGAPQGDRPFKWKASDTWYTLKTRVDVAPMVPASSAPRPGRGTNPSPKAWTLEVAHVPNAHTHGSPGLWGFVPQSRFRVYVDNISVTPNE